MMDEKEAPENIIIKPDDNDILQILHLNNVIPKSTLIGNMEDQQQIY